MKKLSALLITLGMMLPLVASAVTTVQWGLTNTSDTFVFPLKVNNVTKGVIVAASSTLGGGTTGLTISGSATTTGPTYFGGTVGVGTFNPLEVNANSKLVVANTGPVDIIASSTDNTTLSTAILEAYAPGSRVFIGAHGSNQITTQYGIVVGGWGELGAITSSFGTSNGLLIGTRTTASPVVFGTNSLERMRILSGGQIGVASSSPFAKFSIHANNGDTNTTLFAIGSSTATATTTVFRIDNVGHQFASSTSPILSACGTGPTMLGSDHHGTVTAGAATNGCVITFGQAYPVAPTCVISNQSMSVVNAMTYAVSTAAITITETGLGGAKFDFICYGN